MRKNEPVRVWRAHQKGHLLMAVPQARLQTVVGSLAYLRLTTAEAGALVTYLVRSLREQELVAEQRDEWGGPWEEE